MTDDLKPCPFCGSTSIRIECFQNKNWEKDFWITCENCDATSGVRDNETSVIELWNRRVKE